MTRRTIGFITLIALMTLGILVAPFAADAQPPAKVPRIGLLSLASPAAAPHGLDAFREGLRKLGWREGQDIALEYRWAVGKVERLPALAAELVRLNVDLFVTYGEAATRAAWQATSTIPIIMVFVSDPVGIGFVASLARPGGTITGVSTLGAELSGKNLELLKELLPRVTQVAVLTNPARTAPVSAMERAAQALGVQLRWLEVRDPEAVDRTFSTRTRSAPARSSSWKIRCS